LTPTTGLPEDGAAMRPTLVLLAAIALAAQGSAAQAQEQDDAQQRCITMMNTATAGVVKAQGKANTACLKSSSVTDVASLERCLSTESTFVADAGVQLENVAAFDCPTPPAFGVTTAETARAAAVARDVALFHDIFGDDLTMAMVYRGRGLAQAKCQRNIQKAYEKMLQAELKEFNVCKRDGLASGTITSRESLAACLGAMTADAKGRIA
jgi:hypothetical protein